MIADITIPYFEWWWVPTAITLLFGSIYFLSKEKPDDNHNIIGAVFGGFLDIIFLFVCSIIPLVSWLIYFIFN